MSGSSSQSVDPIDSLIDFSEYDVVSSYQSPSLSPATTAKTPFARPVSVVSTPTIATTAQPQLTGPSHQYDLYKQQTGIVPGALASAMAANQGSMNPYISGYNSGLMTGLSPENDLFDFNSDPSQALSNDMDMEFDSPTADPFFFPETVNPTSLAGDETSPSLPSPPVLPTSNVGRLYPGMHSQAAMAKAQAQQRQQQQLIMQQRQQQQQQQTMAKPRGKSAAPTDPLVEAKISQLLSSMRAKSGSDDGSQMPMMSVQRPRKDEEEMDEDERLLASEEGKKLTSKERRQLRNKVSARAFRSRRKEYITQLEAEIANKVAESNDLRVQNRGLMEENKRLTDLTRMLLSSPSFSNFLNDLSSNPANMQQAAPALKLEQRQEQQQRQLPKDVNPYTAQHSHRQQIGMAMIPEQNVDFSMLSLDGASTAFDFIQPQVYAVLETPDVPTTIDVNVLSGKTSNFVGESFSSDDEKVELPAIETPKVLAPEMPEVAPSAVVDEEFENDPAFALYHSSEETVASAEDEADSQDIFGGIEPEKVLARYELLDASEEEQSALFAMARVQRLANNLDAIAARLELMSLEL